MPADGSVAYRIHPTVQGVQTTGSDPAVDAWAGKTTRHELADRQHPVVTL